MVLASLSWRRAFCGVGDQACHKQVVWLIFQFQWRANLFDPPCMHDHGSVGHGHRFSLILGDVDQGGDAPIGLKVSWRQKTRGSFCKWVRPGGALNR